MSLCHLCWVLLGSSCPWKEIMNIPADLFYLWRPSPILAWVTEVVPGLWEEVLSHLPESSSLDRRQAPSLLQGDWLSGGYSSDAHVSWQMYWEVLFKCWGERPFGTFGWGEGQPDWGAGGPREILGSTWWSPGTLREAHRGEMQVAGSEALSGTPVPPVQGGAETASKVFWESIQNSILCVLYSSRQTQPLRQSWIWGLYHGKDSGAELQGTEWRNAFFFFKVFWCLLYS